MEVEIHRSARRQRTISAHWEGEKLVVLMPEGMAADEERRWVERMMQRATKARRRAELNSDGQLQKRAQELNRRHFEGKLRWQSLRYVTNQEKSRFGSCTPSEGTIRISHHLADMPPWVLDYVLVHELAHLVHRDHSARFWSLVNRYPLTERARGFLIARGMEGDDQEEAATS
ncbi:MAG: M48 metallopeptidase family protein [Chloroflexota bacterium]